MVSKKNSARVAPKLSASSLLSGASTHKTNSSSIIRSAFSPTRFQLSLFASTIQALDSHQLRIHDTVSGRLRCEHLAVRTRITSLDWGYYGSNIESLEEERPSKKKKRKIEDSNGHIGDRGDVVIAFGTDEPEIHLFSPAEAKVLLVLRGGHTEGVLDFKFKNYGLEHEGWSIGNEMKLVQWNLQEGTMSRTIAVTASPSLPLGLLYHLPASILVASNTAYLVDLNGPGKTTEVGKGISTISTLLADVSPSRYENPDLFLAASAGERYVNLFSIKTAALVGSLVAGGDVESIATCEDAEYGDTAGPASHRVLAAVTKNGEVELFSEPFKFETKAKDGSSLKSLIKQKTRQHSAKIKITRPDKHSTTIPLVATTFHHNDLVIAYQEGSGHLGFERVVWRDEMHNGLALSGPIVLTKAKTLLGLEKETTNGVKDMGLTHVDESKAVVTHGSDIDADAMAIDQPEVIDISSADEEESDSEDEEQSPQPASAPNVNGAKQVDSEMHDASISGDEVGSDNEPTFGDLLRANGPETIDVSSSSQDHKDQSVVPYGKGSAKLPSGMSLGTVLSQSLRTNDISLLEACFHEQDLHVVRATIERLDSTLATSLLQKLAERLHSRPGRAGSLMVWIQWTLVAHGGHLGAQPDIVKKLTALHRVVKERANSLQPLLALKGKLDMLEAQMNLRRSMNTRFGITDAANDEDDEDVVYVEGQDDSSSSGEEEQRAGIAKRKSAANEISDDDSESDSSDDAMLDTAGPDHDDDEEDDDDGSSNSDADGFIDDEASETTDDEGADDEVINYEDVDSAGEDSDSEEEATTSSSKAREVGKPLLTNGVSSKRR